MSLLESLVGNNQEPDSHMGRPATVMDAARLVEAALAFLTAAPMADANPKHSEQATESVAVGHVAAEATIFDDDPLTQAAYVDALAEPPAVPEQEAGQAADALGVQSTLHARSTLEEIAVAPTPAQVELLERIRAQVNGAFNAAEAQRKDQ